MRQTSYISFIISPEHSGWKLDKSLNIDDDVNHQLRKKTPNPYILNTIPEQRMYILV